MTIQEIINKQHQITQQETARFCAALADNNKGFLAVGDMIRKHFNIIEESKEEIKKNPILTRIK